MNYWQHTFQARDSFRDRQRRGPAPAGRPAAAVLRLEPVKPAEPQQPPGPPRCARKEWCASAEHSLRDDGTTAREAAVPRYGPFCDKDTAIIRGCLADPDGSDDLPALHGRLIRAPLAGQQAEVLVHMEFGPSVLLRLDTDEVARWITAIVAHWHERIAFARGLALPDTRETSRRSLMPAFAAGLLAKSVRILHGHLEELLALPPEPAERLRSPLLGAIHPGAAVIGGPGTDRLLVELDGAAAGREILRLQYTARAVLGETDPPVVRLLGVPCRRCRRDDEPIGPLTLAVAPVPQHKGDPEYKSVCARCGHLMLAGEYAEWVALVAAYQEGRLTDEQIADLPPDLRRWVLRRRAMRPVLVG